MKKSGFIIGGLGIALIVAGIIGVVVNASSGNDQETLTIRQPYGMMSEFDSEDYNSYNRSRSFGGMMDENDNRAGNPNIENAEKLDIETLKKNVSQFISSYGTDLSIDELFVFSDTDDYFSIVETKTGKGAMELLVNPYTGDVFPEYGPNMMWNTKYGMHDLERSSMMSGRMMGRTGFWNGNRNDQNSEANPINSISEKDARAKGNDFLAKELPEDMKLTDEVHDFYGYYTFHIEKDGKPFGMLSVNGETGEVWYHDWHGELAEVIENP